METGLGELLVTSVPFVHALLRLSVRILIISNRTSVARVRLKPATAYPPGMLSAIFQFALFP